jgi:membrane protease YdiL (CAAX protease family)
VFVVASLPAVSEEMLFRWALIPAIYPDWRGVVISGVVFGVLHLNGGRNAAFALWASIIGILYGSLYLHSQGSLIVPILAHATANISSAQTWLNSKSR